MRLPTQRPWDGSRDSAPPTLAGLSRSSLPRLAARSGCLLGAATLAALLLNGIRADGVRFSSFAAPSACVSTPAANASASGAAAVEVMPAGDAASLCGDPATLIADVRPADEFARGHVSGAIHLPCSASGLVADTTVGSMKGRRTLILYGATTADARRVAEELRRRIDRPDLRVVALEGGFSAWDRAGLACASGPCTSCQDPSRDVTPGAPGPRQP